MSAKVNKWTPSHFPRGTVIKTQLFRKGENGELIHHYSSKETEGVEFTVDHVKVVPTVSGRNTLIVTTTKEDKPLYDGDDYIVFNIDHVTEIVSVGKKTVIKYEFTNFTHQQHMQFELGKHVFIGYSLSVVVSHYVHRLNPQKEFDIASMITPLLKFGVFKFVKTGGFTSRRYAGQSFLLDEGGYYKFDKKKFKKWLKQNINRFIITEKQCQKLRDQIDEILYRDMEDDFDREYDNKWIADDSQNEAATETGNDVPEPLTLKREKGPFSSNVNFNQPFIEDEEPPFEEYEKMSPEEKAHHDGLYGGCTEADFA